MPSGPQVTGTAPAKADQEDHKLSETKESEKSDDLNGFWKHQNDAGSSEGSKGTSDNINKANMKIIPFEESQEKPEEQLTMIVQDEVEQAYPSPEEQEWLESDHPRRKELMEDLLDNLFKGNKERALDVACGDGRLSREVLVWYFNKVDLFDSDQM